MHIRLCFGLLYLICNSGNVSHALNVRWELVDFLHQVLHHFYMTLKKDVFQCFATDYHPSSIFLQHKSSTAPMTFRHKPRCSSILWPAWHTAHLAERCHEGGYFAVVCCIHISSSLHQQLNHIKVATVSSKPQRGVPLLISHVNVSPSTLTEQKQQREMLHSGERTEWYCTLPVLQRHTC